MLRRYAIGAGIYRVAVRVVQIEGQSARRLCFTVTCKRCTTTCSRCPRYADVRSWVQESAAEASECPTECVNCSSVVRRSRYTIRAGQNERLAGLVEHRFPGAGCPARLGRVCPLRATNSLPELSWQDLVLHADVIVEDVGVADPSGR